MITVLHIFLVALCHCTDRPIIGILTQPVDDVLQPYGNSYIAASYVKYIESGGGRVVPVFHDSSTDQLDFIFNSINGLLFPGGGADLQNTTLYQTASYLYKKALAANDNGDYFPLFGHCMGFELLAMLTSQDLNILSGVDAENITLPLSFTPNAYGSRWFARVNMIVIDILANQPVTMNNHVECVSPADFENNPYLPNFYDVLSVNYDRKGKEFISTMEGQKYPVYAMQWHAEKNQFEWDPNEVINHSPDAIYAMEYFSQFLVDEARNSNHSFHNAAIEMKSLIYNYPVLYSAPLIPNFQQAYVFP